MILYSVSVLKRSEDELIACQTRSDLDPSIVSWLCRPPPGVLIRTS